MKKTVKSTISLLLALFMIVGNMGFIRADAAEVNLNDGLLAYYDLNFVFILWIYQKYVSVYDVFVLRI